MDNLAFITSSYKQCCKSIHVVTINKTTEYFVVYTQFIFSRNNTQRICSKQILLNLVSGILILYYAVFFISFVVINLFMYFHIESIYFLLLRVASAFSHLMLWYGYVVSLNGKFYFSNISDYNFVIWIIDSFNNFGFFKTVILILEDIIFFSSLSQYFIFIALIFFIRFFNKKKIFILIALLS